MMNDKDLRMEFLVILTWLALAVLAIAFSSCGAPHGGPITGIDAGQSCDNYTPTLENLDDRTKVCIWWYSFKYVTFDGVHEAWACGEWI